MQLLDKKDRVRLLAYTLLSIVSGLLNFMFLLIVNQAIDRLLADGDNALAGATSLLLTFVAVVVGFILSRWILNAKVIEFSQKMYWGLRERILRLVVDAHSSVIADNRSRLYAVLANDVNTILEASTIIITFISSAVLVVACFVYLAFLNIYVFGVTLLAATLGVLVYLKVSKASNKKFENVRDNENKFLKYFNYLLDLNKELQVFPRKGQEIFSTRLKQIIDYGEENNTTAYVSYLNSQLISQFLFYTLIVFVLFYANGLFSIGLATLISITFVLLYLFNPLVSLLVFLPTISRAAIAVKKVGEIERELKSSIDGSDTQQVVSLPDSFERLSLRDLNFDYRSSKFSVGPIDLDINQGEIIFIYGGNGSGKSTLIYVILDILKGQQGTFSLNDGPEQLLREQRIFKLFSPVFSDFKLFDRLYAMGEVDADKVASLIRLFELEDKVTFSGKQFSTTTELSLGQRKRLALIMAILEDRPILILDEWAADQDPYFRKKFYTEIIHYITRQENKTILAITHDDKYYDQSDRLFKMDYGKLIEIKTEQPVG